MILNHPQFNPQYSMKFGFRLILKLFCTQFLENKRLIQTNYGEKFSYR